MADIKINGATPSAFYVGSTAASAVYYGSTQLWPSAPPAPVLPSKTIRCKFATGYTPTMGDSRTLVDSSENIWDIYKSGDDWGTLFYNNTSLVSVIAANTTGVTNMGTMFCKTNLTTVPLFDTSSVTNMYDMFNNCTSLTTVPLFDTSSVTNMGQMFYGCTSLTTVPLFDTSSVTNMGQMFRNCMAVESGALALYQQASTQTTPPQYHTLTFKNCGANTIPGDAELAQIPSSWGGNGA